MRVLGIDLGSREVKIAISENGIIVDKRKISTMRFYRDYCKFNGKVVLDLEKLDVGNIDKAVSTGYGKNNTNLETFKTINEIKAHVYGSMQQTKLKNFIMLDIGGQDVKIVKVENGIITDLELNEKCAASCGRYLENMANVLEIDINEMSKYYENPIELNSTCSVFSESELIGKIAEGIPMDKLCAGVNYSLYNRIKPFLTKFNGKVLVASGGVAHNESIIKYLENDYEKVVEVDEPQYSGAIGCCYYGEKIG